jgi:hypothetical protein
MYANEFINRNIFILVVVIPHLTDGLGKYVIILMGALRSLWRNLLSDH